MQILLFDVNGFASKFGRWYLITSRQTKNKVLRAWLEHNWKKQILPNFQLAGVKILEN